MAQNWVEPAHVTGAIVIPSSKSIALRYILLASLSQGKSVIHNVTYCDDVEALLSNFNQLGVSVERNDSTLIIEGRPWKKTQQLNCGESGFLARTLPFLCAVQGIETEIVGCGTLLRRDLTDLCSVFEAAGGTLSRTRLPLHVLPFEIQDEIEVGKQTSSQALSGLLMALPLKTRFTAIKIANQPSEGYLILTMGAMREFGALFREIKDNPHSLLFSPKRYVGCEVTVPSDWSAAAHIIATLQAGDAIHLNGLDRNSAQPDSAILSVLEILNIESHWTENSLHISLLRRPANFSFDATNCPDLFPALAALAAQCDGESCIDGVNRLRNKESDRGLALLNMLRAFEIPCRIEGDSLYVTGGTPYATTTIPCAQDHRITVAAGAIALRCHMRVYLDNTECVSKSFPQFFEVLSQNRI